MTSDKPDLRRSSVVVAGSQQVSAELTADGSGQAVILDTSAGKYFELNRVGAHVWRQIQEPQAVETVLTSVLETFDVEEAECEADLLALLADMLARGLVELRP